MSKTIPANGAPARVAATSAVPSGELAQRLRSVLGVELANAPGSRRNGHLSTVTKAAGSPFAALEGAKIVGLDIKPFRVEVDTCPFCEGDIPRQDAHTCTAVVLYTDGWEEEQPDGSVVEFRPNGLSAKQINDLERLSRT